MYKGIILPFGIISAWDPELGSAGSGIKYPINMTWTLGVEFGF